MQPPDPFFTNDLEGLIKILGVIAAIVGPTWAFMWKALQGPLKDRDEHIEGKLDKLNDDVTRDINGWGGRVTEVELRQAEDRKEREELRRRMDRNEMLTEQHKTDITEIKTKIDDLRELSAAHKTEIIDAFQARTQQMIDSVTTVRLEVAGMKAVFNDRNHRDEER